MRFLLLLPILILCAHSASAQTDFRLSKKRYAREQTANDAWGMWTDIINEPTIKTTVQAVAAYYGVPPQVIEVAATESKKWDEKRNQRDASHVSWTPPSGWQVCNISFHKADAFIGDGSMSVNFDPYRIASYYYLKQHGGIGRGRSLFDVVLNVIYVRDTRYTFYESRGKCVPNGQKAYAVIVRWDDSDERYSCRRSMANPWPRKGSGCRP